MTLGELIKALEAADPELAVPHGFGNPHSYRGYYDDLAFEPRENVTAGQMLAAARSALGATFHGWKGGEYAMAEYTDCWLAVQGCTGEGIGPVLLRYMLAPPPAITVTPAGYQGPAAHTYTPGCAGHHAPMEPCPPAEDSAPPSSSIVRDILLLAGEDVPTETIDHWTLPELLEVTAWASAEHLAASDNPVSRLARPSVLDGSQ